MTDQFKIALLSAGSDSANWDNLADVLVNADIPVRPDWTFQRYSSFVDLDDGSRKGQGLPRATWALSAISEEHRNIFREYCPEDQLSAEIYVMTPTNEFDPSGGFVWFAGSAQMKWTTVDEDKDVNATLGFMIEFDFMEEVV